MNNTQCKKPSSSEMMAFYISNTFEIGKGQLLISIQRPLA